MGPRTIQTLSKELLHVSKQFKSYSIRNYIVRKVNEVTAVRT
jgi:hypothetical protein